MVKKTLFFCLIIFLFFVSCSKDETKNKNIIDKKTFVNILTDIQLAYSMNFHIQDTDIEDKNLTLSLYYKDVLDKYKVSAQQYNETLKYYEQHPEKLQDVLEEVASKVEKTIQ